MELKIVIIAGPGQGMSLTLRPGDRIEIGRASQMPLCVATDRHMSRRHAVIEYDGANCRVSDLGSANGTCVNGMRIESAQVEIGAHIEIGNSILVLQPSSDDAGDTVLAPLHLSSSGTQGAGESGVAILESPAPSPVEPTLADPVRHDKPAEKGSNADIPAPPVVSHSTPGRAPMRPDPLVTNATAFPAGTLFWTDEHGAPKLTVIVKASYTVDENGKVAANSTPLPVFSNTKHFRDQPERSVQFETDLVPFKPRADVVLVGRAHAPGGTPVTGLDATLQVGSLNRTLRIFGDRQWAPSASGTDLTMSPPQSFVRMPLIYERAYGGRDPVTGAIHPENPIGTGYIEELSLQANAGIHLPNIEDPADLIERWDSRPQPAGFGFIDRRWSSRQHQAGIDSNAAHPAMQIEGYLQGGETVELVNLTPESRLQFLLPKERLGIWLRPAETDDPADGNDVTALATLQHGGRIGERGRVVLDTLVLLPENRMFYMVFRTVFDLSQHAGDKPVEIAIIA